MGDPYSSTARVKEQTQVEADELGLTSSEFDNLIDTLLRQSRDKIDSYCRRDFELHESVTIELDGDGERVLNLPNPVHSVSKVVVDEDELDADAYQFKPYGSLLKDEETRTVTSRYGQTDPVGTSLTEYAWEEGVNNVEVTLTYGYEQVPDDPQGTYPTGRFVIPEDVVGAEVRMVDNTLMSLLSKREQTTVQVDDYDIETNIPNTTLTREVKQMLSEHQAKGIGGFTYLPREQ